MSIGDHLTRKLSASADERMLAQLRVSRFARRTWFSVTVAAIFAVHASILAILLWRDHQPAASQPKAEETAVEVVVQAPEQPQPQAPPAPPEKPATSAPRADNPETQESDDRDTHAPKLAATPVPPQENLPDTAKPDDNKPDQKEAGAKPPDETKQAETLEDAAPEPPRRPSTLPKPAKQKAKTAPTKTAAIKAPPRKTPIQQLAGTSDLPDYTFAKPMRKHAKFAGGTEDDRYLAVIYAMVTQNHEAIPLPDGDWSVAVAFQVDGHGDLVGAVLKQSSGYREIDTAAIDAVERAAPFPPPPSGTMTGLVARLSSARARAAALAGAR